MKILVLCGDFWHPAAVPRAGLGALAGEAFQFEWAGVVAVDWVYNSMPPVPGQIYPPVTLETVKEFEEA